MENIKCYICSSPSMVCGIIGSSDTGVRCPRCGYYSIGGKLRHRILKMQEMNKYHHNIPPDKIHIISSWIKERSNDERPYPLDDESLEAASISKEPGLFEKAEDLMLYLSKKYPYSSQQIPYVDDINTNDEGEIEGLPDSLLGMMGASCIRDFSELEYILDGYIIAEKGLIKKVEREEAPKSGLLITPAGWAFLEALSSGRLSRLGFVAMSFDPKFDKLHEAICRGIELAGRESFSLKRHRHNNNICSEIIAGIKKSRFLVADFTDNCQGAYYEAGYAKGHGLDVIHTVREDYLGEIHFDTKQTFHLKWTEASLNKGKFVEILKYQIEDTIGFGPK